MSNIESVRREFARRNDLLQSSGELRSMRRLIEESREFVYPTVHEVTPPYTTKPGRQGVSHEDTLVW